MGKVFSNSAANQNGDFSLIMFQMTLLIFLKSYSPNTSNYPKTLLKEVTNYWKRNGNCVCCIHKVFSTVNKYSTLWFRMDPNNGISNKIPSMKVCLAYRFRVPLATWYLRVKQRIYESKEFFSLRCSLTKYFRLQIKR